MLHKATIKSQVKKEFTDVQIVEIKQHSFGMFSIKVKKETSRTTKIGLLMGRTDHDNFENGVDLDEKIEWLGSI